MLNPSKQPEEPLYILNPKIVPTVLKEKLRDHVEQLSALTELGLNDGIVEYPKWCAHNYLLVIYHYANRIHELTNAILSSQPEKPSKGD